jgi:hypothetical protein
MIVSTIKNMTGGSTRPDSGLMRIEAIPLPPADSASLNGVRLASVTIAGSNLRAQLAIDPSTPSGLLRATIPRGGLPEPWWFEWDRTRSGGQGGPQPDRWIAALDEHPLPSGAVWEQEPSCRPLRRFPTFVST